MKVLFLFNKIKTGSGEIENIEKGMGHDSHLFGMLRLRKYGVETGYLEIEHFFPEWFTRFVRRYMLNIFWVHVLLFPKFFNYDIVFTSTAYGSLLLWAIYPFKKPKWVILDFNILGTIGRRETLRQKLFNWAVSRASGIVTIGEKEKNDLQKQFPDKAQYVEFIHEATDTEYFKPNPQIAEERFVLSVGRDPGRDFETLIKATERAGVPLVIATKPHHLKALEPLPPHVTVRHFSPEEMARTYSLASMVAIALKIKSPNSNDSMGTFSLIEAMSMGKAVAVTDTQNMRSYIENNTNGILVPAFDVSAWEKVIADLVGNPGKRRLMGQRAREFAVKNTNADLFAERLHHYFARLIKGLK
jgi:glycosyltransferase involved in cell wall biosynthesis